MSCKGISALKKSIPVAKFRETILTNIFAVKSDRKISDHLSQYIK